MVADSTAQHIWRDQLMVSFDSDTYRKFVEECRARERAGEFDSDWGAMARHYERLAAKAERLEAHRYWLYRTLGFTPAAKSTTV
jgi:hypothetical protein